MNKTKRITEISSFDEEVPIYKNMFQARTTSLLKHVIEKISVDRNDNMNSKLPSILLSGKGEGKSLLAKSFSTSLCSRFEHIQSRHISAGGGCGSLFQNVDSETVYYISACEELTASSISMIFKLLTQGFVRVRSYRGAEFETVSANNKLLIFSTDEPSQLCPDLYKAIDYHCYLQEYSSEQMEIILEQRLRWSGVDHVKEVPAIVAHNGGGTISGCIRLLSLCYLIMRSDGRTKMILEDIEKAIGLNSQQVLGGPPIPDDIAF